MNRVVVRWKAAFLAITLLFLQSAVQSFTGQAVSARAEQSPAYSAAAVGDIVYFGRYAQRRYSHGGEPIAWIVLDEKDGRLLLISRPGLETGPYNSEKQRATWAESSLRTWLNQDFLSTAFSQEEQAAIRETTVVTPGGSFKSPATGEKISIASSPDTQDKVFLLSVSEAAEYLTNTGLRRARNSEYLLNKPERKMPYPSEEDACDFTFGNWWLRDVRADKGIQSGFHIKSNGKIASAGQINLERYVIRPAIWVDAAYPFEIAD